MMMRQKSKAPIHNTMKTAISPFQLYMRELIWGLGMPLDQTRQLWNDLAMIQSDPDTSERFQRLMEALTPILEEETTNSESYPEEHEIEDDYF